MSMYVPNPFRAVLQNIDKDFRNKKYYETNTSHINKLAFSSGSFLKGFLGHFLIFLTKAFQIQKPLQKLQ